MQLVHDIPDRIKTQLIYGDQIKLQLVLSDFMVSLVQHTPSPDGWVEIKVSPGLKFMQDGHEYIHLQFSLAHPGQGLPPALIEEMFGGRNECITEEGIALNICQKLVNMMNGHVHYVREHEKCYFQTSLDLRTRKSG